jgi:hypothetical protein
MRVRGIDNKKKGDWLEKGGKFFFDLSRSTDAPARTVLKKTAMRSKAVLSPNQKRREATLLAGVKQEK